MPNIFYILFVFGLVFGSFLNVCIHRLPLDQSVVSPGSHCPKCRTPVRWYDNIPLISYVMLLGRCRHCRHKISFQYPLVELLTGLLSIGLFYHIRLNYPDSIFSYFLFFFLLICPLIVITFIDLHYQIIPDVISLPGILAGIVTNLYLYRSVSLKIPLFLSIQGILVGGGALFIVSFIYEKIKKQEGIGGGDIKLAAMLGAFFGWKGILLILFFSSLLGSIVGLIVILTSKEDFKLAIPYGPFLSIGTLAYLFFGESLLSWYLGLFRAPH